MDNFSFDTEKGKQTQAYKKVLGYVEKIIQDPKFQKAVIKFRKKYKLPLNGLKEGYPFHLYGTDFRLKTDNFAKIVLGLEDGWSLVIENYIIYNRIETDLASGSPMMEILDLNFQLNGPLTDRNIRMEKGNALDLKEKVSNLPVAILISPYASERDIVDLIKKLYKTTIKPIQLNYKGPWIELGEIRGRKKQARNIARFIYEKRSLPAKDIASLVAEKFKKYFDQSYIYKIVNQEKEKDRLGLKE